MRWKKVLVQLWSIHCCDGGVLCWSEVSRALGGLDVSEAIGSAAQPLCFGEHQKPARGVRKLRHWNLIFRLKTPATPLFSHPLSTASLGIDCDLFVLARWPSVSR